LIDQIFSFLEKKYKRFDIRFEKRYSLAIELKKGKLERLSETRSAGHALRVVENGNIGYVFLAGEKPELKDIKFKISYPWAKPLDLKTIPAVRDEVSIKASKPLDTVDIDEKISLLRELDSILMSKGVENREIYYRETIVEKHIRTSEGTEVIMRIPYAHLTLYAGYKYQDRIASIRRSWGIIGGWEHIDTDPVRNLYEESAEKVKKSAQAKSVRPGTYNVIVDGDLNHLLAHEALGHASEADLLRVRTILRGRLGKRIASPLINLVDDKKFEINGVKGFGWIPYDDEGVSGGKTYIIKEGIFRSFITNRETAYEFGFDFTGNGRAQDWMNPVIVRMTNTLIEPARHDLAMSNEELIRELGNGLLLRYGRGGQVDPTAGVFTFGVQEVYLVENGEIKEQLASTSISGNILIALRNIVAVGREYDRPEIGAGFCGKSGQRAPVGACGVWLLVKNMHVGG